MKLLVVCLLFYVVYAEPGCRRVPRQTVEAVGENLRISFPGQPSSLNIPLPPGWKFNGPVRLLPQQDSAKLSVQTEVTNPDNDKILVGNQMVDPAVGRTIPARAPSPMQPQVKAGDEENGEVGLDSAPEPKIFDCADWRSGAQKHGSAWKSRFWHLQCNNGTVEVIACITNTGEEIPVGETKTIDGFWHKCEDEGQQIRYSSEPSCVVNNERLHIGDTFRTGSFKMRCQTDGYSIVGCIFKNSEGELQELDLGDTFEEGIIQHSCKEDEEHEGRVRYLKKAIGCRYNGKEYKVGDKWIARHKEFECTENGGISINKCVTDKGLKMDIGTTEVVDNIVHRCYRLSRVIYYHAYQCGENIGVSCVPEPIPTETASSVDSAIRNANGRAIVSTQTFVREVSC